MLGPVLLKVKTHTTVFTKTKVVDYVPLIVVDRSRLDTLCTRVNFEEFSLTILKADVHIPHVEIYWMGSVANLSCDMIERVVYWISW